MSFVLTHWKACTWHCAHGVLLARQVLLLLLPGGEGAAAVDAAGERALAVLRNLGLPACVGAVAGAPGAGLKQRAAAKKRAAAALDLQAGPVLQLVLVRWSSLVCGIWGLSVRFDWGCLHLAA